MGRPSTWLICAKCGETDKTDTTQTPHYIGTKTSMKCRACTQDLPGNTKGFAMLCRKCCPTGHGTRIDGMDWNNS
jgi:hypothetical protein